MTAKSAYKHVQPGEWVAVPMKNHRDQCCDCGLVHRMNYRIRNGKLEIQAFRDGPATGGARRRKP